MAAKIECEALEVRSNRLESLLHFMRAKGRRQVLVPGSTLFHEGEPSSLVYLVERGGVEMVVSSSRSYCAVGWCGRGDFAGLCAAFSGRPHPATALTTEMTEVLVVSREELLAFVKDDRPAFLGVLELLSTDVNRSQQALRLLAEAGTR